MFQTRGIERRALQKMNRKYGAFGTLILIVPIATIFVVGSIVIAAGEYQKDMKMFAGCETRDYPTEYYETKEDCLSMAQSLFDGNTMQFVWISVAITTLWALLTIWLIRSARRLPRVLIALDQTPEKVVWAFEQATRMRGSKIPARHRELVIGLENGKQLSMWAPSHEVVNQLLDAVREHCPGATIGFSEERAKQFNQKPASLRLS